jgi:hypothetical protein
MVVIKKHCVAGSGLASVGETRLVSVIVDYVLECRGVTKKVVVEDALEVAEDALHYNAMGLTGIIYVETHLLDRVDVRLGVGEVL